MRLSLRNLFSPGTFRHVLGAVAICLSLPALGQFGDMREGLTESLRPEFTASDLATLVRSFDLSNDQRVIVELHLMQYRDDFEVGAAAVQQKLDDFREDMRSGTVDRSNWREMIEDMQRPLTNWRKDRAVLSGEFLGRIKDTLDSEQLERWPTFERRMTRVKAMPRGRLSGERIDLIAIASELGLDGEEYGTTLQPILLDYELQLDDALRSREEDMGRTEEEIRKAIQEQDFDLGLKVLDRQARLRTRIRDLNEGTALNLQAQLPSDLAASLDRAVRERGYPQIYRPTHGQQVFEAAAALPDLTEATLTTIASLSGTYEQRLATMNDKLVRATRRHEPTQLQRRIKALQARMNNQQVDQEEDPIRELMRERSELDSQFDSQLRAMLTEEQRDKLPRQNRRPDGQGRNNRRGRGGG